MIERSRRWVRRVPFGARLLVTLLAAIAAAGAVGYPLLARGLEGRLLDADWSEVRAQAHLLRDVIDAEHEPVQRLEEVHEALDVIAARPGTLEAKLIGPDFRVDASARNGDVGEHDRDARLMDAVLRNRPYAGREADPTADSRDFEYIVPVRLPDGMYAFEVTRDHTFLDGQLTSMSRAFGLAGVIALLIAIGAFWPLGGRRLLRAHRRALEHATLDGLTQLGNHRAFQDELEHAVARARRHAEPLAMLLIDLDDFKQANDRHGHRHGDDILRRVGNVLRGARGGDRAYRLGGDEFAVLLPGTGESGAQAPAARLLAELSLQHIAASVGVGELGVGQDGDALRQQADASAYEAKRRGGGAVVAFSEIAGDVELVTRERGRALRDAIAARAVNTVFQPIWRLHGGNELLAVEALARIAPEFGFAGPAEAFDVAQQIGCIHDLDVLCVSRALEKAPDLPDGALMFINLAPQTLDRDAAGDDWLRTVIEGSGLEPERIVIEVTERLGGRTAAVLKALERIRALGVKVAIDDVGTGNAGLELLRTIGADYVKIDRSIVAAAAAEEPARAVLLAISAFAAQTGTTVIAEGIEDQATLELVRAVDRLDGARDPRIHAGQGYGLGRPSPEMPHERLQLAA
jgi:diguanylate cyclase (GGDEF)-like protein